MRRPEINITPSERIARVVVGLAGTILGFLLLGSAAGVGVEVLAALLALAGLGLVGTGALGYCQLYRKLGHVPRSLRRAS